ncbi:transposase [Methanococcoides alaskense]|uniref:Transposase n=1 Tax=Methanococcoides alaskense TaxID=325778 RepID=A0AA90ZBW1_9EURY|nr:transposase [Methanococcoides alaskense]
MLKAFKYRMYPTKEQEEMFFQHFGSCRFIYNWALDNKIKSYQTEGKSTSRFTLNKMLTELKVEHEWLKDVNSQSLQGATLNLESLYEVFQGKDWIS